MITMISIKIRGGYKIMRHTVVRANVPLELQNHKLQSSSRHSHIQEVTTNDTPLNSRQGCIVLSISNSLTCFLYLNVKAEL
jgi:hypothetical protein